jgi:hypothetical protein
VSTLRVTVSRSSSLSSPARTSRRYAYTRRSTNYSSHAQYSYHLQLISEGSAKLASVPSGGAGAAAGGAAPAAGAADEAAPAEEKAEEKEESDDDMGFGLFD